jgi:Zn-dependent M28 family amino/carboxypeptidase
MQDFFRSEGVVAVLDRGSDSFIVSGGTDNSSVRVQRTDGGTIFVGRLARPEDDHSRFVPTATIAVEHYNRMVRILEKGLPVKVALNIQTAFHDEGPDDGFNVIAEIPGTDLASEVVMIGGHFDTQYAGTGATDNSCGSAGAMEVMRILKAIGARPRRTIRMALWGGEEVGHLGSRHYAREHFGDPETMALKPEHEKLAAYFNVDNGTGRIRGVWMQGNLAVAPIFRQWMEPLKDLGVTALASRSVGGTDHLAFDELGLPGFQFIQDRLEYNSRTHHSNMDVVDHVVEEDMMQVATVWAVFAYNAAMRDQMLPREALPAPRKPAPSSSGR